MIKYRRIGLINSKIGIAGAKGIVLASNHSLLSDYGGPVTLTRAWAHSMLQRMKFVKRKSTTVRQRLMISSSSSNIFLKKSELSYSRKFSREKFS